MNCSAIRSAARRAAIISIIVGFAPPLYNWRAIDRKSHVGKIQKWTVRSRRRASAEEVDRCCAPGDAMKFSRLMFLAGKSSKIRSSGNVSLMDRYRTLVDLFQMYRQGGACANIEDLCADFNRIDACTKAQIGRSFETLNAVEIGFGAKPYRIIYFNARGVNTFGIDMDRPIVNGSPIDLWGIARKNGLLRAAKSGFRFHLFERQARQAFLNQIHASNPTFAFDTKRLIVGNAGTCAPWDQICVQPDVIYSFRVFEHIDPESLESLIKILHQHLHRSAVMYIVITVYTGIIGNHLTEWYPHRLHELNKRSHPWEHLRRNRFHADTYLNKLTRRQYADLFSSYFEILTNEPVIPDLGREFLTDDVRYELAKYDEYELLSNDCLFVLRPSAA
ncbi:MAG: hypothetical protein WAU78_16115 [Roseiarcus sp.]